MMKKLIFIAPSVLAAALAGCAVYAPGPPGGAVVIAPPLPAVVESRQNPFTITKATITSMITAGGTIQTRGQAGTTSFRETAGPESSAGEAEAKNMNAAETGIEIGTKRL